MIIVYHLENNLVTCFNDDGMEDILNGHFLFIFSNNKVEIHPKGTGNFLKLCLEVVNMALAIPRFMLFWAIKGICCGIYNINSIGECDLPQTLL